MRGFSSDHSTDIAPYIEQIITEPFALDAEGCLPIPERPGLGIELDRDALARFAGK